MQAEMRGIKQNNAQESWRVDQETLNAVEAYFKTV